MSMAPAGDCDDFARQVLAADWACYSEAADRAEFPRMRAVIACFPQGFRLYCNDEGLPVGYTGWYPVSREVFDRLHDTPQTLRHRGEIAPLPALAPTGSYIYAFNYSIVERFRKTPQSARMIQTMASEIAGVPCKGLSAVTVSDDGVRVATRFGMNYRGEMTHDGVPESVYAVRL